MSVELVDVQDAQEPFSGIYAPENCIQPPDFILRSSWGVDFHVHKSILQFTSDFFAGMFAGLVDNTDSTEPHRDGKPILTLPDSTSVLYRLLSLAYPAQSMAQYALGDDVDEIFAVYEAAHKYQFLDVQHLMNDILVTSPVVDVFPLRLFDFATLYHLPKLARKAALRTLRAPLSSTDDQQLYDFHLRCGLNASDLVLNSFSPVHGFTMRDALLPRVQDEDGNNLVWWTTGDHSPECGPLDRETFSSLQLRSSPAQWFQTHMTRVASCLLRAPSADTVAVEVSKLTAADRAIVDSCAACAPRADRDLASFARQLGADVHKLNSFLAEKTFLTSDSTPVKYRLINTSFMFISLTLRKPREMMTPKFHMSAPRQYDVERPTQLCDTDAAGNGSCTLTMRCIRLVNKIFRPAHVPYRQRTPRRRRSRIPATNPLLALSLELPLARYYCMPLLSMPFLRRRAKAKRKPSPFVQSLNPSPSHGDEDKEAVSPPMSPFLLQSPPLARMKGKIG
ncbi:BTB domain-containing protein [Mycena venus]|uniref:BTB domain-containing protein n=1 Tax=Mycena venus TaxID=2733690 RepID=A0A8H6X5V8_9AGAR|nr:BTB domain-containing protein [Mycena venus]